MRTATLAQIAAIKALDRETRLYVEVQNASGVWVDLANFQGTDWINGASTGVSEGQPATRISIDLHREVAGVSLAPLMSANPLLVEGAAVRVGVEISEAGEAGTGRVELAHGTIDDASWGGDDPRISMECRDQMGQMIDEWVREATEYSGALETVAQAIMTDWLTEPGIELLVESDPDFTVSQYSQQEQSVLQAVSAVVSLIGYYLLVLWRDDAFRVVLVEPPDAEAEPTPADTITPRDYYEIPDLQFSGLGVRDMVILKYRESEEVTARITVQTPEPLNGRYYRPLFIDETENSQVRTEAVATALAEGFLRVVSRTPVIKRVVLPFDWRWELGDWGRFEPNNVHYSEAFEGAITGIEHQITADDSTTTLDIRSSFAGPITAWVTRIRRTRTRQDVEPEPEAPEPIEIKGGGWYYTTKGGSAGFSRESTRDESLGRYISTTRVPGGLNSVFRSLENWENGQTLYAILGLANTHDTLTWEAVKTWISEQSDIEGAEYAISLDPAGVQALEQAGIQGGEIADDETEPGGASWSAPEQLEDGLPVGDLPPRSCILVRVRLDVTASPQDLLIRGRVCAETCPPGTEGGGNGGGNGGGDPEDPPSAPSLSLGAVGDGSVSMSWTSQGGTHTLYRSTVDKATPDSGDILTDPATSPYEDTAVSNSTTYYYWVTETNEHGTSGFSNRIGATPSTEAPGVPPAPTLTLDGEGDQTVDLSWSTAVDVTHHTLYRSTVDKADPADPGDILADPATSPYQDTAVSNGTSYFYWVTQTSAGGTSDYSNRVDALPEAPPPNVVTSFFGTGDEAGGVYTSSLSWSNDGHSEMKALQVWNRNTAQWDEVSGSIAAEATTHDHNMSTSDFQNLYADGANEVDYRIRFLSETEWVPTTVAYVI